MTAKLDIASVREHLRNEIAAILYAEPEEVSDDLGFRDMGFDSILAADLVSVINTSYSRSETIESVYSYPTLAKLSAYIAGGE